LSGNFVGNFGAGKVRCISHDYGDEEEEEEGDNKCVVLTAPSVASFFCFSTSLVLGFEG
jgi:hypothetical protein